MRALALVVALAALSASLPAQSRVVVTDLGPGPTGRILEAALAQPHRLIEPDTGWFTLARHEQALGTLIVLGRTAAIAGNVEGDVIVVGGDLFVRPGARISGRAIAVGGGAYPSTLAIVEKGIQSHRDNTFIITRDASGYRLAYLSLREHSSPPLLFPGIYGLRFLTYDRVNGASLPFGPAFTFAGGRGQVDILATYRSDLGQIDPTVAGGLQLTRRMRAVASAGRTSFSNDAWIWSNLVNSFAAFTTGEDTRNFYRADRGELTIHRLWETTRTKLEPFAGVLAERAWSVGPAVGEQRGPWSIFGKADTLDGMRRPNPAIEEGGITSLLVGGRLLWESDALQFRVRSRGEINGAAPSDQRYTQVTSDIDAAFPTFGEHEYALDVHWVTTFGDTPPAQRFVYLGGAGTLPFLHMLEQGGDEALLIDQRYSIPVSGIRVGMLGEPTLIFRHRLGSAGLGKLPSFEQMIGAGVILTLLRLELQMDVASGRVRLATGFSFAR